MKKHIDFFMVLVVILVSLAGCSRNMDYVIAHEPCFIGQVEEVTGEYVVVAVNENESIYDDYPTVYVSLDVEQADSCLHFEVGDEIAVYYDGNITDGDPAKTEKVYAITVYAITMRTPESRETE